MANDNVSNHVRYVVVVHGIGDQRKNETVLAAISRFHEARAGASKIHEADVLTLGMLSGQTSNISRLTGRPQAWIEFEDIPCVPNGKPNGPFLARRVTNNEGQNIRFVDICWADIMRCDFPQVGETVDKWSSSLVERLRRHPECPGWALRLIVILRKAVLLVQQLLLLRFSNLADKVFNEFLGDVQLYGEYGPCRAQAVRRFHEIMGEVQAAHDLEQADRLNQGKNRKEARYTIVAHSLGTIMSLDALLYACAESGPGKAQDCYPGYLKANEKPTQNPLTSTKRWIGNVDAFVTLGSPVDKYLVLWWLNYEHLADDSWLCLPERDGKGHKIKHFNYSDEQDPVGGELDVAHKTPAVRKLFNKEADLVFTRYPIPGIAHVDYWKDLDLFKEILHRAVDHVGEDTKAKLKSFCFWKYILALVCNYVAVSFLFWGALSFFLTLAVYTDSWHTRIISLLASGITLYLATKVFHFVIEGRQAVIYKLQPHKPARRHARLILPGIYAALVAITSRSAWMTGKALCARATLSATGFWARLAECDPWKFILSATGLLVFAYGLCAYLYFKYKNRKPESIELYRNYIDVGERGKSDRGGSVTPLADEVAAQARV